MDWQTHVVLASKVLEACGLEKGCALYSNLPAIDSKPPHYHRVYGHILENQPIILEAALNIFTMEEIEKGNLKRLKEKIALKIKRFKEGLNKENIREKRWEWENKIYVYQRICEEIEGFLELSEKAGNILNDKEITKISNNKIGAGTSLISHIFFDTFNNPIQAFLPYTSLCSGQWELWDEIDYMAFRYDFYKEQVIKRFRKEISSSNIWNISLKPEALIKAMIIRVGEQGQPHIPYEAVDLCIRNFLRFLDINEYQRVDREVEFLRKLEIKIGNFIKKSFPKG